MGRTLGSDAVGQIIAFLVGGLLFLGAIAAALLVASSDNPAAVAPAADRSQAVSLLSVLVESEGEWGSGPDDIDRLGLAAPGGRLDPDHLEALRGAFMQADPDNGKVDYEEALESLGLDRDFHLRIIPTTLGVGGLIGLEHLKVAYIGDWTSLASVDIDLGTDEQMKLDAFAELDLQMAAQTANERAALVALGVDFTDNIHLTLTTPQIIVDIPLLPDLPLLDVLAVALVEGDVYPDHKQYLDDVLAGRVDEYDVIIVGTGVDQSTLTTAVTKDAIRDWVLAGGKLYVMGSDTQNFQWMQPLFSVGVSTVNGGAFSPDPTHPILNSPNELGWPFYDNHDLGWDLKDQGSNANYDDFTHVVVEDGEDLLTYSDTGSFGDGRVLLTTWRPKEIHDDMGGIEAQNFIENMLVFFDLERLRLDYGPPIPDGVAVAAAVRESTILDSQIGPVPVRIELHLW